MKKLGFSRTLAPALLLAACFSLAPPRAAGAADVAVSVSFFHQELSPFGRWEVVGRYGECWIPGSAAAGWQPYVDGEWVYTDLGWTWVSDDPWGEYPYHYGTWVFDARHGWVWIPGLVWAPAWVTWSYNDDYIGWAPVPPSFGITLTGYAGPPVVLPAARYVFVPVNRFVGVRVASVRLPPRRNSTIFRATRKITSYRVSSGIVHNSGPPVARIERAARARIAPRPIAEIKVRPRPVSAAGVGRGKRIAVAAPAAVRGRSAPTRAGSAETAGRARSSETKPGHGRSDAAEREGEPPPKPAARSDRGAARERAARPAPAGPREKARAPEPRQQGKVRSPERGSARSGAGPARKRAPAAKAKPKAPPRGGKDKN